MTDAARNRIADWSIAAVAVIVALMGYLGWLD